ncbi:hypothetical protein [Micromonospora coxensis]|uniref:hypothetical protein n=1 Tax=Micromonospora coxensis TaxID=356852 RepID=UPI0012FE7C9E|nr:hypothetical protein [Micromonospora coxensis]
MPTITPVSSRRHGGARRPLRSDAGVRRDLREWHEVTHHRRLPDAVLNEAGATGRQATACCA